MVTLTKKQVNDLGDGVVYSQGFPRNSDMLIQFSAGIGDQIKNVVSGALTTGTSTGLQAWDIGKGAAIFDSTGINGSNLSISIPDIIDGEDFILVAVCEKTTDDGRIEYGDTLLGAGILFQKNNVKFDNGANKVTVGAWTNKPTLDTPFAYYLHANGVTEEVIAGWVTADDGEELGPTVIGGNGVIAAINDSLNFADVVMYSKYTRRYTGVGPSAGIVKEAARSMLAQHTSKESMADPTKRSVYYSLAF